MPWVSNIKDSYVRQYAQALAEEGKALIDKAYSTATYNKNKTQNLHDSYGSCVYYDGKEVSNTRRYVGRKATVGKTDPQGNLILGRAEIDNFFDTYKPSSDGFELVTAVAIFYGEILENKGGKLRHKYKVISGMNGSFEALAKELGGTVERINF